MFLAQHKWPPRLVGLCLLLTLAFGSGHRLHAQTRIVGASTVPPKTIDVLRHRYGLHKPVWRRWPGAATARPKKKTSPRTETIPMPRPKKKETQTGPGLKDRFPEFPLDGIDNNLPPQRPRTQPFRSGDGSLPSKPFDLNSDPAPKPTGSLKHAEPKRVETVPPRNDPKRESVPDGGAAISPLGRNYQARWAPTIRSGRYDRQPPASRYQTGRARVLEPATHYAPRRAAVNRPSQGRSPQGRFDNPLRSGMRTAHAPPPRAVPVANWSAQGARDARLASPIRSSVAPRSNPLRP